MKQKWNYKTTIILRLYWDSLVSAVIDRYLAPIADQAKKQLFKDNIKPGQSLLGKTQFQSFMCSQCIFRHTSNLLLILYYTILKCFRKALLNCYCYFYCTVQPNSVVPKQEPVSPPPTLNTSNGETTPNSTPKKAHNSLILFFRKVCCTFPYIGNNGKSDKYYKHG